MRDWHSAWSWLKEMVAADSVAGNTFTGMLTRLTLRKPFHVARAAIRELYRFSGPGGLGGLRPYPIRPVTPDRAPRPRYGGNVRGSGRAGRGGPGRRDGRGPRAGARCCGS